MITLKHENPFNTQQELILLSAVSLTIMLFWKLFSNKKNIHLIDWFLKISNDII